LSRVLCRRGFAGTVPPRLRGHCAAAVSLALCGFTSNAGSLALRFRWPCGFAGTAVSLALRVRWHCGFTVTAVVLALRVR
jgi:hypothetical protein